MLTAVVNLYILYIMYVFVLRILFYRGPDGRMA